MPPEAPLTSLEYRTGRYRQGIKRSIQLMRVRSL